MHTFRFSVVIMLAAMVLSAAGSHAGAHCQVPCGIYDDAARVASLKEDVATVVKAIGQIEALAGKGDAQSQNQLTRWVHNKELHATRIIEVVANYFLTQRVKPVAADDKEYEAYVEKLVTHHAVIVAAMKVKQGVDPEAAVALGAAVNKMGHYYE